jgi:hypothetical protein
MASLWRILPIRPLLWFAGAIPVHRAKDGATARNVDAFAAARRVLGGGGVIGIFPEGQASDEPHLLPVKTGAARIAFGASADGARGIRIVPVGLIYERKQTARSRAYVRVGEPVDLDAEVGGAPVGAEDRGAVGRLTARIERGLADAALDYADAAEAAELGYAAAVFLRKPGGSPSWAPRLSAVDRVAGSLASAPAEAQTRVREAVTSYRRALEANGLHDRAVAAGPRGSLGPARVAAAIATVVAVPLALVGLAVNGAPALLVHLAGRRPAAPVTMATVKFLVGLVAFPVTWLVLRYVVLDEVAAPWPLTVLLGPVCGLAAAVVADRARRARLARLRPSRLAIPDRAAEDLAERRAWLVDAVGEALAGDPAGQRSDATGSLDDRP